MGVKLSSIYMLVENHYLGCKKPTDGQIKLTELIKFFSEVKIHDHANYFVDSLWDHTEVMQVRNVHYLQHIRMTTFS